MPGVRGAGSVVSSLGAILAAAEAFAATAGGEVIAHVRAESRAEAVARALEAIDDTRYLEACGE